MSIKKNTLFCLLFVFLPIKSYILHYNTQIDLMFRAVSFSALAPFIWKSQKTINAGNKILNFNKEQIETFLDNYAKKDYKNFDPNLYLMYMNYKNDKNKLNDFVKYIGMHLINDGKVIKYFSIASLVILNIMITIITIDNYANN